MADPHGDPDDLAAYRAAARMAQPGETPCPVATCRLPSGHAPPCAGPGMGGGYIVARRIINHGTITFGSINGEPTFTLSAAEVRLLWRFLTDGGEIAREFFDDDEKAAWESMNDRFHSFLCDQPETDDGMISLKSAVGAIAREQAAASGGLVRPLWDAYAAPEGVVVRVLRSDDTVYRAIFTDAFEAARGVAQDFGSAP